jgi:hypothetical protein
MKNKKKVREFLAAEFSKNWYTIYEAGKKKTYYYDVYFCPKTGEIQIGTFKSDKQLFDENFGSFYGLWKSLTRQMLWHFGSLAVWKQMEIIIEESADIDEFEKQLIPQLKKMKFEPKKWICFSGGYEK